MNNDIRWRVFFSLLAIGNVINGLWMLISPNHWYLNLPGRIPDFGPMNEHFIRDMGCLFIMLAIICVKAIYQSSWRAHAFFILQLWFIPHAVIHLFDTLRGLVSMEHLYMDIPLCYGPPILIAIMQCIFYIESQEKDSSL